MPHITETTETGNIAAVARAYADLPRDTAVSVLVDTRPPVGVSSRLLLTHGASPDQALEAMRQFAGGLPLAREANPWALEVPEYATTVAERLEAIRDTLEAGRNMSPVRREAFEREAASLGSALGSILARVLLEQRRGES